MKSSTPGPQFLKTTAVPILGVAMPKERIDCEKVTKRLTDYLEGDLSPADHHDIEAHLTQCNSCFQTYEELRLTISLLGRLPKHKR